MKKWMLIAGIALMVFSTHALSSAEGSVKTVSSRGSLLPVAQNSKWGYIDRTGKIVIEPQFLLAGDYSEGMAVVLEGDPNDPDLGYIDETGKVVIKPQYDSSGGLALAGNASRFSDGLAAVQKRAKNGEGKFVYIDKQGNLAIKAEFDFAHQFSEGLACVRIDKSGSEKWGYIDRTGKMVVAPQFDAVRDFSEGLAAVRIGEPKKGKWGFIDKTGKLVIKPQYHTALDFSEGLAAVGTAGNMGYIDRSGKTIIKPQFAAVSPFSEGLASFLVGDPISGKTGFIDKHGNVIIKPQFGSRTGLFSEGLAPVLIGDFASYLKDPKDQDYPRWGFIDMTGKMIIEPMPGFIGKDDGFSGGVARIRPGLSPASYFSLGPSYIDKTGKFIWKASN